MRTPLTSNVIRPCRTSRTARCDHDGFQTYSTLRIEPV
nr:MAG TPA: hypothetical protein [Caudoviricetes sp.]